MRSRGACRIDLLGAFVLILISAVPPAWAGTRVGNGGAGWLCRDHATMKPRWLTLVDLFEARTEYGLTIPDSAETDPWKILDAKLVFIRAHVPRLAALLTADAGYLRSALHVLPPESQLQEIGDGQIRVRPSPSTCEDGYLYYFQLANFTHDGRLLVNGEMWASDVFAPLDRAGLLTHELVYKALRDRCGDRSSSRARAIVGLLFSDLEAARIAAKVDVVLEAVPQGSSPCFGPEGVKPPAK